VKRLILIVATILLFSSMVFALPGTKSWKAIWDANTESDLAGYHLYWRADSEEFTDSRRLDCGIYPECSLSDSLNDSYIAVTAYDDSGNESDFSGEVFFSQDSSAPAAVGGLQIVEE